MPPPTYYLNNATNEVPSHIWLYSASYPLCLRRILFGQHAWFDIYIYIYTYISGNVRTRYALQYIYIYICIYSTSSKFDVPNTTEWQNIAASQHQFLTSFQIISTRPRYEKLSASLHAKYQTSDSVNSVFFQNLARCEATSSFPLAILGSPPDRPKTGRRLQREKYRPACSNTDCARTCRLCHSPLLCKFHRVVVHTNSGGTCDNPEYSSPLRPEWRQRPSRRFPPVKPAALPKSIRQVRG